MMLPLSKSAPRAFWAFMILSVSSISVGMNRSAMAMIMASSCAGKPTLDSGFMMLSRPSVSAMGDVVSVKSCDAITSSTSRKAMNTAFLSPSRVMVMNAHRHSTVPSF